MARRKPPTQTSMGVPIPTAPAPTAPPPLSGGMGFPVTAPAAAPAAPAAPQVKIEQWSPAKDREYADAVARGDMATAARLVAERDALVAANDAFHQANKTGPYAQPSATGGGGGGGTAAATQDRTAASLWLKNLLNQYGMGDLVGSVDALVQEWGDSPIVIGEKLKETQSYKDRFKGLLALQSKGVGDIRNEAEYLNLETQYRKVFRDAGIQSYIGDAGSVTERDNIAKLVGDYMVSVDEVTARVADAQRVVNSTSPEVRDALQRYYNVSASDLVGYTLDPTRGRDRINTLANSAIVGGYAASQGLMADVTSAEQIASLSGANDIQVQPLVQQLGQARQVADATKRLANLEDTSLTDSDILRSEFDLDPNARQKIKTLQSRERARFSGTGAVGRDTLSRSTGF